MKRFTLLVVVTEGNGRGLSNAVPHALPGFSSNDALSYKVRMYVRQWAPWLAALRSYTTSPPLSQVSRARDHGPCGRRHADMHHQQLTSVVRIATSCVLREAVATWTGLRQDAFLRVSPIVCLSQLSLSPPPAPRAHAHAHAPAQRFLRVPSEFHAHSNGGSVATFCTE